MEKNTFEGKEKDITKIIYMLIIGIVTFYPFLRVGVVVNDDLQAQLWISRSGFFDYFFQKLVVFTNMGRTNFFVLIAYYLAFALDNFTYFKIMTLGSLILDLVLLSYLLKMLFDSDKLFYLSLLLSLVGLQNSWEHNPVTAFPCLFTIPIGLLLLSMILLVQYTKNQKKIYLITSLVLYLTTLFAYELYVLYLPVYILILAARGYRLKHAFMKALPYLGITLVYILTYICFRNYFGSDYAGAQLQQSIDPIKSLKIIWQFSISSVPTYFFFNDKYRYLMYIYSDILGDKNTLSSYFHALQVQWIIKAILSFTMVWLILSKEKTNGNNRNVIFGILFSLLYFFVPSMLQSLTPMYHDVVFKYNQLGIPSTYFSFLAFIFAVTLSVHALNDKIKDRKKRLIFITTIALMTTFTSLTVDFTNHYISKYQAMSNYKWQLVDKFMSTKEFSEIPDKSVIYAPTLWYQIGSVSIHDTYWSDYLTLKSGKKITVEKDVNKIVGLKDVYYLKFTQSLKEFDQNFVFAKINEKLNTNENVEAKVELFSDSVYVYNLSKYDDYYIIGQLKDNSPVTVVKATGSEPVSTDDDFSIKIDNNRFMMISDLKTSSIVSSKIDLDSVVVVPGTNNEINFNEP